MTQQRDLSSGSNWFVGLLRKFRLAWRLFRDPLVPVWTKLIPLGAVLYILLPVDFIPDAILGLGQMDDVSLLLLSLKLFLDACPTELVERHLAEMSSIKGEYRVVPSDSPQETESHPSGHEAPKLTHVKGYLEGDSLVDTGGLLPRNAQKEKDL